MTAPTPRETPMRALVARRYGPPEVLGLEDLPVPSPGPGEVLVRVRAAAVTRADHHLLTGRPALIRVVGFGLLRPKQAVPGQYGAGTVEAVGRGVEDLAVGDEVFGFLRGSLATLAVTRAEHLARRPADVSPEVAATLPHGALTALQALRDAGRLRPGHEVLVIGAAGSVGSAAVQLAQALGARVTAAARRLPPGLAVDRTIGTAASDLAGQRDRFDLILDATGHLPHRLLRRALKAGGRAVMVSGGPGPLLGGMGGVALSALASTLRSRKLVPFLTAARRADLEELTGFVQRGELTVPLTPPFDLVDAVEAFRALDGDGAQGRPVVRI